jgi:outer membrane receptor protein involved in Fe transport
MQIKDNTNLRVSYFEKKIKDPIIELFFDSNNINFDNGDGGEIRGVELELDIQDIGPLSLVTNLTYIDAQLDYTVDNGGNMVSTTSSFPYQPEWIFNANLGYENDEWDFGINLIYNFVGQNTTIIRRRQQDPSLVLGDMHSLDLVMRKGFGKDDDGGGWVIGCGIKNLYATDKEYSWDGGANAINGRVRNRIDSDRTYFVEAKCSF